MTKYIDIKKNRYGWRKASTVNIPKNVKQVEEVEANDWRTTQMSTTYKMRLRGFIDGDTRTPEGSRGGRRGNRFS